ncbi:MAG: sigma-54-dependent transcriptional regulator [Syntrophales bacterium]
MERTKILLVDDEPAMRSVLAESLSACGYEIETAESGTEALRRFPAGGYSAVITDVRMPKTTGMEVLKGVKKISPQTPVIVITAFGTVNTAVEAMKEGAADFLMKPFALEQMEMAVRSVVPPSLLERGGDAPAEKLTEPRGGRIVTRDKKVLAVLEMLERVARSKSSVLIQGESGTGKELFARHVHRLSNRSSLPFVAVNCAAIPHHLLESEMFGYEKGAFTGASQRKLGKFELADTGTLLLDEIGEMDIQLQAKLLRVIQEGEVDRVGGHEPVPVDVRIIATTNADLLQGIEEKKFRSDLYYRLNVVPIKVPPLRERNGDVELLSEFFLTKYSRQNRCPKPRLSAEALALLRAHTWPGNVRELENVIERAVLLCVGDSITAENLCLEEATPPYPQQGQSSEESESVAGKGMTLRAMEKNLIFETLQSVNGNKTRASEMLGVSVRTIRNKLNEYQMENLW